MAWSVGLVKRSPTYKTNVTYKTDVTHKTNVTHKTDPNYVKLSVATNTINIATIKQATPHKMTVRHKALRLVSW